MSFSPADLAGPWDYAPPREDRERVKEQNLRDAQIPLTPSQFIETTVQMPNPHTRTLENFSFEERGYLREIYDIQAPRVLLMCGRQVEKTVLEDVLVKSASGEMIPIKDVKIGDELA